MSATFTDIAARTVPFKRGREIRVSAVEQTDRETHYAVSLREHVVRSSADLAGSITAGNGRTRSTYTGPTRNGFYLSPGEALQLAEDLAAMALEALAREEGQQEGVAA